MEPDVNPYQVVQAVSLASAEMGRELQLKSQLSGGQHAVTWLVGDGAAEFVARIFPPGDAAVSHEIGILERLSDLGGAAPRLQCAVNAPPGPIIVTSRVPGNGPPAHVAPDTLAAPLARMLAQIHSLPGEGLRPAPLRAPTGDTAIARSAQIEWGQLDTSERVLTHYDYWSGNALWDGSNLTGVVDWSGARHAPRGVDVAWCRQDLVLLGSAAAADTFLGTYQAESGVELIDIAQWDRQAAAQADPAVETWAPNYAGIGRGDVTPPLLRKRLDAWSSLLLTGA